MKNGEKSFESLAGETREHFRDALADLERRKDPAELMDKMQRLIEERSKAAILDNKEKFEKLDRDIKRINRVLNDFHKSSGPNEAQG